MADQTKHNAQPSSTGYVYFGLTGEDLVPSEITQAIGIKPDKSWQKGDRRRGGLSVYPFGNWVLKAPYSPEEDNDEEIEYQIEQLLARLEQLPTTLHTYIKQFNGAIIIVYNAREDNFGFYLPAGMIQRLAQLGLNVWFDLYYVDSEDDTNTT